MRNENIVNVDFRSILLLSLKMKKVDFEKNVVTCCTTASGEEITVYKITKLYQKKSMIWG